MRHSATFSWRLWAAMLVFWAPAAAELGVHPTNPRWLTEDGGATAIVLTGAHTWSIFQDYEFAPPLNAGRYLRGLARDGHNFTRGWAWEDGYYSPLPYARERGLYRLSPPYKKSYLKRLRQRIRTARREGLYVSVMLFQGWSMGDRDGRRRPGPWPVHPYNRANTDERVTKQQEDLHVGFAQSQQLDYVSYLAGKLCREPNVIWEVANEPDARSLSGRSGAVWKRQVLREIANACAKRLTWVSCPSIVGLSQGQQSRLNDSMIDLGADLVAPCNPGGRDIADPPYADGRAVLIADSDHLGAVDYEWAWKAFLRGQHPVFMDLTEDLPWWQGPQWDVDDRTWTDVRRALGAIQELVADVNRDRDGRAPGGLAEMAPQVDGGRGPGDEIQPASSRWALFSTDVPCPQSRGVCIPATANGNEVVAYARPDETLRVCSLGVGDSYRYRWKRARRPGYTGPVKKLTGDADGCVSVTNPASVVAILHLERLTR